MAELMLYIAPDITIPLDDITMDAVRASGAGGQHVNKVATAVHLRFDIRASSLPDDCKQRLLKIRDRRITRAGMVVIKAQQHRSQEQNRRQALERLQALIRSALVTRPSRRPTRPTFGARRRRMDAKRRRGDLKKLRAAVNMEKD